MGCFFYCHLVLLLVVIHTFLINSLNQLYKTVADVFTFNVWKLNTDAWISISTCCNLLALKHNTLHQRSFLRSWLQSVLELTGYLNELLSTRPCQTLCNYMQPNCLRIVLKQNRVSIEGSRVLRLCLWV